MKQQRPSALAHVTLQQSARKNAKWLWIFVLGLLTATAIGLYGYRTSQEFEVTGELLYKDGTRVNAVRGARINVYEDKGKLLLPDPDNKYWLVKERQFYLQLGPATYDPKHDAELASLGLAPLSKMTWGWWDSERLQNCFWAEAKLTETLQRPALVASTSTDMSGHYWLKLRRGKYFVAAESEVPSFWRIEDRFDSDDRSQSADGKAFWLIPINVAGTMKVVSADPDCNPN